MNYVRRFVFVHYEDLLEVRFRQLEKVTDKLYVFVPSDVEQVPLWLVRQVQAMGRDLAWIDTGLVTYEEAKLLMAFRVGTLHEQVDPGVEFAILSDAPEVDALVEHLQRHGRQCLRIKPRPKPGAGVEGVPKRQDTGAATTPSARRGSTPDERRQPKSTSDNDNDDPYDEVDLSDLTAYLSEDSDADDQVEDLNEELGAPFGKTTSRNHGQSGTLTQAVQTFSQIGGKRERRGGSRVHLDEPKASTALREPLRAERTEAEITSDIIPMADDVVRKLIRSGHRPKDLSSLRGYILLHNEEAKAGRYVDDIIRAMRRKGEIEFEGTMVKYTF